MDAGRALRLLLPALLAAGCTGGAGDDGVVFDSPSMEPHIPQGARLTFAPVASFGEVETLVEGGSERWGLPGDVVGYRMMDRDENPVIAHRAIAYVEVRDSAEEGRFWVRWGAGACEGAGEPVGRDGARWCVWADAIDAPSLAAPGRPYAPEASGLVTKGDNPRTNPVTDQQAGLARTPLPLDWLVGKVTRVR